MANNEGISLGLAMGLIEGAASPAAIESAVSDWLDDHPEATTTVQDGSITEAKLASALAQKVNQVSSLSDEITAHENAYNPHGITPAIIGLTDATVTARGLMSPQDKQKLDNILSPVSITITGSGVTKNASAFGFLPTNDAETNSDNLQAALDGGGTIIVDYPGVYSVCKTALLDSNTTLIFGANVFISRAKNASNVTARYPFINRGAFTHTRNENISIIGLNLLTNGYAVGTDIPDTLIGVKGQLSFYGIKNLLIKDFTISDGTSASYYNIHIQDFENINLENIHITSQKDGIHLGAGKKFAIRDVWLKTNDDGIALNAHDYPTSTMVLGWIEDGTIENVHFLAASEMNNNRGIYMLGGSWSTWESGMTVRDYGDAVVSDGRIYRTYGTISAEKYTTVSTDQPTHLSGVQTYSDGVTWLMAQDTDVGHDASVKNVSIRNVFYERASSGALTFRFDNDMYSRSYYPGSDMPYIENISVDSIYATPSVIQHIINANAPFKNVKLRNINASITGNHIFIAGMVSGASQYPDSWCMLDQVTFDHNETVILSRDDVPIKIKICDSLPIGSNLSFTKYGSGVTVLSNDIGI